MFQEIGWKNGTRALKQTKTDEKNSSTGNSIKQIRKSWKKQEWQGWGADGDAILNEI